MICVYGAYTDQKNQLFPVMVILLPSLIARRRFNRLTILFRIAWWPSAGKELSSWRSGYAA